MDADQNRGCCAHLRVNYSTTPTGDGHTVRGFWACETCGSHFAPLLPAASGWVEVTDDEASLPPDDPKMLCLAYFGEPTSESSTVRTAAYLRGFAMRFPSDRPLFTWMPWPAASAPAACGHGALLREAADRMAHTPGCLSNEADYCVCYKDALAARLRAAADAAGKEGK